MNKIAYILLVLFSIQASIAQEGPGAYMNYLSEDYEQITKDTWDYVRITSRGRNAGKIEKRRKELAATLRTVKYEVNKKKSYNGDKDLRDAIVKYLELSYLTINDDYKKIVDMEKIAEQSYDDMEAYIMTKEQVNAKLDSAYANLKLAQDSFAAKYNVTITKGEKSRISKKLTSASKVNKYHNKVYLIFFRSTFYEGEMLNAQNEERIGDIEQFRQTLEIVSDEGLNSLKEINAFQGDNSLVEACRSMLEFYRGEAIRYVPKQIEFFNQKDNFETVSKNFETKKRGSLTQEDIDEYNSALEKYNKSIAEFNETNAYLNKFRKKRAENFRETVSTFYDKFL
ncbi:MAG: hypothetical protein JXR03_00810 [Cyclobacteriaceae bacterium]